MSCKKKNIAVVFGGDSSEYVVSVESSKNVFASIDREKFNAWKVQVRGLEWDVYAGDEKLTSIDKSDFSFSLNGEKITFDSPISLFTEPRAKTAACKAIST
jgi:D-alanine-D-alanine ligase